MFEKWPDFLPIPSAESYQIKAGSSCIRTTMSAGNVRQRRVSREPLAELSVTWNMTPSEFALFEYFFIEKINGGEEWFEMYYYSAAGWSEGTFRFSDINSPYSASNIGYNNFKVSATLERAEGSQNSAVANNIIQNGGTLVTFMNGFTI